MNYKEGGFVYVVNEFLYQMKMMLFLFLSLKGALPFLEP